MSIQIAGFGVQGLSLNGGDRALSWNNATTADSLNLPFSTQDSLLLQDSVQKPPPSVPGSEVKSIQKSQEDLVRETVLQELTRYHNVDGKGNGGKVPGVQYPPFLEEKDAEHLQKFIQKLADFLSQHKEVAYLETPSEKTERDSFRRKIAEAAREEVRGKGKILTDLAVLQISDSGLKKFARKGLEDTPEEFFLAPSSSTGTHHPPDEINEGGLSLHTLRGVEMGKLLCQFFGVPKEKEDEIVTALILHDTNKGGDPWNKEAFSGKAALSATVPEHGYLASKRLSRLIPEGKDQEKYKNVLRLIETHMAQWNAPNPTPPRSLDEQIVSYADYLGSRDNLIVKVPGVASPSA